VDPSSLVLGADSITEARRPSIDDPAFTPYRASPAGGNQLLEIEEDGGELHLVVRA